MHSHSRKFAFASAFALAMFANGVPAADTVAQDATEVRQETQIWTAYALNPYLRAHDIKVSVHAGKATLTGKVGEGVNKDLARQIALGVSGIKEVDNQLEVDSDYAPPARPEERSFGDTVDDASITAAVKSKLLWSRYADGLATDVDTRSGRVTLKGTADSGAARDLAGRLAANTRGVVSVNNQLVVRNAKPTTAEKAKGAVSKAEQDVSDGWITTKVKSTFMYSSNVDASDITVTTAKGVVTLGGKVASGAERALAIELAQNVRGVRSVNAKHLESSSK